MLFSVAKDITVTKCDAVAGLVVGGVDANPGEFPHMAALGYSESSNKISFKCGGSLISELFVLTAAHCDKVDHVEPSVVRLGDHNLKVRDRGNPKVDIPIERFIIHEAYNWQTRENDIALVRMKQPVTFTTFIRPACLQQFENIGKTKAIATGWGKFPTFIDSKASNASFT
jgi:secreted trypsin-like serine protease